MDGFDEKDDHDERVAALYNASSRADRILENAWDRVLLPTLSNRALTIQMPGGLDEAHQTLVLNALQSAVSSAVRRNGEEGPLGIPDYIGRVERRTDSPDVIQVSGFHTELADAQIESVRRVVEFACGSQGISVEFADETVTFFPREGAQKISGGFKIPHVPGRFEAAVLTDDTIFPRKDYSPEQLLGVVRCELEQCIAEVLLEMMQTQTSFEEAGDSYVIASMEGEKLGSLPGALVRQYVHKSGGVGVLREAREDGVSKFKERFLARGTDILLGNALEFQASENYVQVYGTRDVARYPGLVSSFGLRYF